MSPFSCDDAPGSLAVSLGHILSSVLMLGSVEVQEPRLLATGAPATEQPSLVRRVH